MSMIARKWHYSHQYRSVAIVPVKKTACPNQERYAPTEVEKTSLLAGRAFQPSPSSALLPIATGVMRGMNIGQAGLHWLGDERHWQCRLMNGPCSGLQIDARGRAEEGVHLLLTPPNAQIRHTLQDVLPDIRQAMSVFKIIDIRIVDATYPE